MKRKLGFLILVLVLTATVAITPVWARELTPKEIYKSLASGVVLIIATHGGTVGSLGTGSIISEDGYVITNHHVIYDKSKNSFYAKVFIYLKPAKITGDNRKDLTRYCEGQVVRYDSNLDLALLKMNNPPSNLTVVPLADDEETEVGDDVIAIGHPEQAGLWTLTAGSISSQIANFNGVQGKDVFQTSASINRGNSGGPLLDSYGHMVGINTMIFRQAADGMTITDINFSLKSHVAQEWLSQQGHRVALLKQPTPERVAIASAKEEPTQKPVEKPKVAVVTPPPKAVEEPVAKPAEPGPKAVTKPAETTSVTTTVKPVEQPKTVTKPAEPEVKPQVAKTPPPTTISTTVPKTTTTTVPKVTKPKPTTTSTVPVRKAEVIPTDNQKPFKIDALIEQQMKEMEDLMGEMRTKMKNKRKPSMFKEID